MYASKCACVMLSFHNFLYFLCTTCYQDNGLSVIKYAYVDISLVCLWSPQWYGTFERFGILKPSKLC